MLSRSDSQAVFRFNVGRRVYVCLGWSVNSENSCAGIMATRNRYVDDIANVGVAWSFVVLFDKELAAPFIDHGAEQRIFIALDAGYNDNVDLILIYWPPERENNHNMRRPEICLRIYTARLPNIIANVVCKQ